MNSFSKQTSVAISKVLKKYFMLFPAANIVVPNKFINVRVESMRQILWFIVVNHIHWSNFFTLQF